MKAPHPTPKQPLVQTLKWVLGIACLTLIVAEFFLTNVAKLSADVSGSSGSSDPMGTLFTLSNEGLLPVYDIQAGCEVMRVDTPPPSNRHFVGPKAFYFPESRAEILSPGHKIIVPCGRTIAMTLDNAETLEIRADMFIVVTYRPKGLLWHKSEKFPVEMVKTEDGAWLGKSIPR